MKTLVEFCASNTSSYSKPVMDALESDPQLDVDVLEYGCLGYCGECYMQPFALVNGDFVTDETPEALILKIKEKIKEQDAELSDNFPF